MDSTIFQARFSNISELELNSSKYSSEVMLYDIPWKIKIDKSEKSDELWLSVRLHCAAKYFPTNRFYAASSVIKLMSFDEKVDPIEYSLSPCAFSTDSNDWGSEWIKWDTLNDINMKYVRNDTIKLDVTIKMVDPNDEEKSDIIFENVFKSCDVGCLAKFQFTISNIKNLWAVRPQNFVVRNKPCAMQVYKHSGNLCVYWKPHEKISTQKILLTLVSAQSAKSIQKVISENHATLTSWNNLLNSGNEFIKSQSIIIEVDITVDGVDLNKIVPQLKATPSQSKALKCVICLEKMEKQEISSVKCGHLFCTKCIRNSLRDRAVCPLCNSPASLDDLRRVCLPL